MADPIESLKVLTFHPKLPVAYVNAQIENLVHLLNHTAECIESIEGANGSQEDINILTTTASEQNTKRFQSMEEKVGRISTNLIEAVKEYDSRAAELQKIVEDMTTELVETDPDVPTRIRQMNGFKFGMLEYTRKKVDSLKDKYASTQALDQLEYLEQHHKKIEVKADELLTKFERGCDLNRQLKQLQNESEEVIEMCLEETLTMVVNILSDDVEGGFEAAMGQLNENCDRTEELLNQTIQETERAKSRLLDGVDDDEGVEDEDTEDDLPAPRRKKRNYDETTSLRSSRYSTGSGVSEMTTRSAARRESRTAKRGRTSLGNTNETKRYRNAREWQKREENEKMERMKRLEEEKEARKLQAQKAREEANKLLKGKKSKKRSSMDPSEQENQVKNGSHFI